MSNSAALEVSIGHVIASHHDSSLRNIFTILILLGKYSLWIYPMDLEDVLLIDGRRGCVTRLPASIIMGTSGWFDFHRILILMLLYIIMF